VTALDHSAFGSARSASELLVSERTGLVRSMRLLGTGDEAGAVWLAELADTRAWSAVSVGNPTTAGSAWLDADRAHDAALGEATERYCGTLLPSGLSTSTGRALRDCGRRVISGDALALHAPWQHEQGGFPFVRLDDDTEAVWVEAEDATDGSRAMVPASVVYLAPLSEYYAIPPTNYPVGAGIAAGRSREDAIDGALRELVERHVLATAWALGVPFVAVRVPAAVTAAARLARVDVVEAWLIPNALDVPVVLVMAVDSERDLIGFGCAMRDTVDAALWKAFSEALLAVESAHALDDPSHGIHELTAAGQTPLKPHRRDRQYAADYDADWRDVTDFSCHVQLSLDPAVRRALLERLALVDARAAVPSAAPAPLTEVLPRHGYQVLLVDVTTSDVATAGLHVVRVVVPGLRATAPAAFPFLGGNDLAGHDITSLCRLPVPLA